MLEWIQLIGGGLILYLGAEWFVGGASTLALALRVPQIMVGLTIVAYGTSTPEIIVGIEAAGAGYGDVALANVVGSNIGNIGLILGLAVLIQPPRVDASLARREVPVLLAGTALIPLLLLDGSVSQWEGVGLIVLVLAYSGFMIRAARSAAAVASAIADANTTSEAADAAGAPAPGGTLRAAAIATVGLVAVLIGGRVFLEGAVSVARSLEVSERLVGLTIVAVGTSLPELVTSVIAARRGNSDIAIGNVIGSNIFNAFFCLGSAALAGSVGSALSTVSVDLVALGVMTALAAWFIRSERTIVRSEGVTLLVAYAVFLAVTVARG